MKRNLLILALFVAAFCFSGSANAAWVQDGGVPDTLTVEVWPGDNEYAGSGPFTGLVKVPMYVSNDVVSELVDSVAGFILPICYNYTAFGPVTYCKVTATYNTTACGSLGMTKSIFRHMPDMTTPVFYQQWTEKALDEELYVEIWDWREITLNGTSTWLVSLVPLGGQDQRWNPGVRELLATITFEVSLDDSMDVCLDTCAWESNLFSFINSNTDSYSPISPFTMDPDTAYCFRVRPEPDPWPEPVCPEEKPTHSTSGTYSVGVSATDNVAVASASVSFTGELTGVSLSGSTLPDASYTGTIQYTVDHCGAGGTITFTVTDNFGQSNSCTFDVTTSNDAPEITCPANSTFKYSANYSNAATATDANGDAKTFSGSGPEGLVVNSNGTITWDTDCDDAGETYTVNVTVTDACGATDDCSFTLTVTNGPVTFTCPPAGEAVQDQPWVSGAFSATDAEGATCEVIIVSVDPPVSINPPEICGNQVCWTPDASLDDDDYTITLKATDPCGGAEYFCSFVVEKTSLAPGMVVIGSPDYCVNPGDVVSVPISVMAPTVPTAPGVGGFEFEVGYDFTTLTFIEANFDTYLSDDLGWEYLTYRVLPCPECVCCEYKILIYGQADMPNGDAIGICLEDGWFGPVIWLDFLVCNNSLLRGLCLPIFFEWEDYTCTENTMSSCDGNFLFVSESPSEYDEMVCSHLDQYPPIPILQFFDGCVLVCDEDSVKCERGDINLNHLPYEVADAVLFASYFVTLDIDLTFILDPQEGQVCATDINADGYVLSLPDLVMLIQVILGDVPKIPKVAPSTEVASMIVYNGTVMAECANPLSAMVFAFDGTVTPTLLANNMEMMVGDSRVLVWSTTGQTVQNAEVLSFTGAQLVSVQAVDNEARELQTVITRKATPSSFALHAAYPNPFNPYVNLSFTIPSAATYSMKIYNVAGQMVRSYEGTAIAGLNVITWDGKDNSGSEVSSGVYFCKVTAAGNSATGKMVMMK